MFAHTSSVRSGDCVGLQVPVKLSYDMLLVRPASDKYVVGMDQRDGSWKADVCRDRPCDTRLQGHTRIPVTRPATCMSNPDKSAAMVHL